MGLSEVGSRKIRKVFGANSLEMTLLETVYARYATYLMFVRFFCMFAFVDIIGKFIAKQISNWTFIKIYYGITQFCLFGSIGIVTITAFDRFLTIKSSNLSTRRFRYHLYSVVVLISSGKNLLLGIISMIFVGLMTGPLFMKTEIIDYENDAGDLECKINWSSLR